MVREYLLSQGDFHIAGIAEDGWSAYNMIVEKEPDIVILDVIMPNMDGICLLKKIKEEAICPRPGMIVLSGIGQHEGVIANVMGLGADAYIAKPSDMRELVEKIRRIGKGRLAHQTVD